MTIPHCDDFSLHKEKRLHCFIAICNVIGMHAHILVFNITITSENALVVYIRATDGRTSIVNEPEQD